MDYFILNVDPDSGIKIKISRQGLAESKKQKLSIEDLPPTPVPSCLMGAGSSTTSGSDVEEQSSSYTGSLCSQSPPPPMNTLPELSTVVAPTPIISVDISNHLDNSSAAMEDEECCPRQLFMLTTISSPTDDNQLLNGNEIPQLQTAYYEVLNPESRKRKKCGQHDITSPLLPALTSSTAEQSEASSEPGEQLLLQEEDSPNNQDSSEEDEREMPKLCSPSKLRRISEMSCSPEMPVLTPIWNLSSSALYFGDSGSISDSNDRRTNEPALTNHDSTIPPPRSLTTLICPPPGQISLRGYYYGRWNWGEEDDRVIATSSTKRQKKKLNFLTEFHKNSEWKGEMKTSVLCPCCPAEIVKNTDIVAHIMEHIKIADSGKWELMKFQRIPKLSSLQSQCRLCFVKCPSQTLDAHMRQTHQHINDICCRICETRFDTVDSMSLHHSKFHHVAEMPFCCPICDCRSSSRWDIVQHFQLRHGKEKNALCPYCLKSFDVSISHGMTFLQCHLLTHRAEPEINCPRCCLKFVDTEDFDVHLFYCHQLPRDMHGDTFHNREIGFQCFKEGSKQRPVFIPHPKRMDCEGRFSCATSD